jgi:hypothetical protein
MHTCVRVNPIALDTFVNHYYNLDLPDGSPRRLVLNRPG